MSHLGFMALREHPVRWGLIRLAVYFGVSVGAALVFVLAAFVASLF